MLQLSGITRADRFSVTAEVREALNSAGAWILDHHQFSNTALCINFETARRHVPRLRECLAATLVSLSRESEEALGSALDSGTEEDLISGTLHLMFVATEPHEEGPLSPFIP